MTQKSLAHIVNPVAMPTESDLGIAQPITFESMRIAKSFAKDSANISLFTTQYPEDIETIPTDFESAPQLSRSVLDIKSFNIPRKLPILADILDALYNTTDAEYLIYTNADIALMPNFYVSVIKIIEQGHDAFIINRRTISKLHSAPEELPLMYAEAGKPHPGNDCFIFRRALYPKFLLGDTCIGIPYVGHLLKANMEAQAEKYRHFTDLHLTFHLGDDRTWMDEKFDDYLQHNRDCAMSAFKKLTVANPNLTSKISPETARYLGGQSRNRTNTNKKLTFQRLWNYLKRKFNLV